MSSINKNIEFLNIFNEYKLFLDQLAPKDKQEDNEMRKKIAKKRREEQQRRELLSSSHGLNN